jgi:hypothetical protein
MIHTVYNWIDNDVLSAIKKKFQDAHGKPSFEINNMGRWGQGLDAGSYAPVFVLPLEEYRDYFTIKYKNLDPVFQEFELNTVYLHIWPRGSQINWHHDGDPGQRIGSTIYINETWHWNWGGLFLYDDPDLRQGWIFPEHNKMIWFESPVWHATSMLALNAEFPRLSIQLFFTKQNAS